MASINGEVDQYGFERDEDFNYDSYATFMSEYLSVLARRMAKWNKLMQDSSAIEKSNKVKRYIRKGIPSELRPEVWLNVSSAQQLKKENPQKYEQYMAGPNLEKKVKDSIQIDIKRTFPENIYFKDMDESLLAPLANVLTAYASYNSNIGYCQGLNYIAGMLLLVTKNEKDTFWLLVQMLDKLVPDFYSSKMLGLRIECNVLDELIRLGHPDLHAHFRSHNIDMELFASKWFVCLYMDVLPVETVLRVWDCLFYEGSKVLLRAAYTLIVMNKDKFLQKTDFTELCNLFKQITRDTETLDCHSFLEQCFKVPKSFSLSKIRKLRKQAEEKITQK
ncbi:growth hormone-regulated TBC protein 1-A-like [Hydractinia symbiolongicarpus]|uniref:growth hormone-regulated TBC protein 1-A-like n=1 Tax=Hydractinia symbiolongicarpus TaxID=13093 RepID=UPI0025502A0C|nr:growth hormone-regulated TBC protein 1-A-like [Hydractinia symbiolongicarpus]